MLPRPRSIPGSQIELGAPPEPGPLQLEYETGAEGECGALHEMHEQVSRAAHPVTAAGP